MKLMGKNPDGTNNPDQETYLDVDNLINYTILNLYAGNSDWPRHNYYLYRRRGPESEGFRFLIWDAEFTLDVGKVLSISDLDSGHVEIVKWLLTSEAFRVRFSDRVQELFAPDGPLYVNPDSPLWDASQPENNRPAQVYADIVDSVWGAIGAESARWGDALAARTFTRDESWLPIVEQNLTSFFPNRTESLLQHFREVDVYRDAPTFSHPPGLVQNNSTLSIGSTENSEIYYTTDGADPRMPDGSVSPSAKRYTAPITIDRWADIRARSFEHGKWSAIDGGNYFTEELPASHENLRITELHYHPADDGASEFVELINVGSQPIRLDGVSIQGGIAFQFAANEPVRLAPDERVVVVRDADAFAMAYSDVPARVVGEYEGRASNDGELLRVIAANGVVIQELRYGDDSGWPIRPDGHGPSLQLVATDADPNQSANWRASATDGGTPGTAPYLAGDANLDGRFDASDLTTVFESGQYEDGLVGNSTWATGDWTGDGEFTSADFIVAFRFGHYQLEDEDV